MAGTRVFVVAGVVLTGLSLRSAVGSLGAVLDQVRDGLGMSAAAAGLLTALPVLCFAVVGAVSPRIARRLGPGTALLVGLAAIAAGLAGRAFAPGTTTFLLGSAVALAGAAVGNVVLPVLIKQHFPDRIGALTGLYSMSAASGVALPAALTVPVGDALGWGWRGGLAVWAPVALLAVLPWLGMRPATARSTGPDAAAGRAPWRHPVALALLGYFGLQSLGAFTVVGWLPTILVDAGVAAPTAALLLALTAALAIPFNLLVPVLAARGPGHTRAVVVLVGLIVFAGYLGLLLAPAAAPLLWAVLLTAAHLGFPLAIVLIGLRTRTPSGTARLSGFVQGGGYTIAAVGPLGVGILYGASGSWTVPLVLLLGSTVLQVLAGLLAARSGTVDDPEPAGVAEAPRPG
jgi:CP family cyanate transporter-like MFS transporter